MILIGARSSRLTDTRVGAPDTRQFRSFGLIVGAGFAVIGLLPVVFSGRQPRIWALTVAAALVAAGVLIPRALRPLHRVWMQLAEVLGWINTRIILLVVFFLVIVPTGALLRILGRDILHLKLSANVDSYRVVRTKRPGSHMQRQF
jgi:hypothetical protein